MTLVLTSCTNRKRQPASPGLRAGLLPSAQLGIVAADWTRRLQSEPAVVRARDLYCGRAFREAEAAAAKVGGKLYVVSAGLGLVAAETHVPSYSLTVAPGATDNILARLPARTTVSHWWRSLARVSPYATSLADAARRSRGPLLVALPVSYLNMISDELAALPEATLARLRLITLSSKAAVAERLHPYLLPYDQRFDGHGSPNPGTRGDFAQRALRHFVEVILPAEPKGHAADHANLVDGTLSKLQPRELPSRMKLSNSEIIELINRHWDDVSGQSARMLRHLRDHLGVACEQSRFRDLFLTAKAARGPL